MFQTGRIAARPQGMNAGNNMAFLQQAQSGYGGGFNPFAQATPSRPSMAQGFGAGMYATPAQRAPMQSGQQDIGALLQQFSQMGGMFGGMGPAPFQRNQQQMAAQMQQFGTPMASSMQNPMIQQQMAAAQQFAAQNPMAARMAQMQGQMPAAPRQMAAQLSEADGRAAAAAAQQRRFGGGGRA